MTDDQGRALPPASVFAGDDGQADPALRRALAALADGPGSVVEVVAALAGARVLVPVLAEAEATDTTADGLAVDSVASTGIVAVRTPDGRTALPVFSSTATMTAWRSDARPVPAESARAATSALQEGWEVLVLDPGGPVPVEVPHPAVRALATGTRWQPAVRDGQVRAPVGEAVQRTLGGLEHLVRAEAEPGRRAEVAVVLHLRPGLDRARLSAVLEEAGARLAADEVVTAAVDSLELRVRSVPA